MGRGHLEQYMRLMSEGAPVKLVALCDIDPKKFDTTLAKGGNLGNLGKGAIDVSQFKLYQDFDDMIAKEKLDYIDIALPTFLHSYYAIRAMKAGLHVLCEKPMALNPEQCALMVDASKETGKTLMIAQCLRFWPVYEILKKYVVEGTYGAPIDAFFIRCGGGGAPQWSHQDWLRDEFRSGGGLLDQHVHDVDMINDLFGMPEAVSTLARNVHPGSGFDAVSTHYRFDDFIVAAQDNWSHFAPFMMRYRVHFERGSLVYENGIVTAYPEGGEPFVAEDSAETGYYREIKYFIEQLRIGLPMWRCTPESTLNTIRIAAAERVSALNRGEWAEIV